MLEAFFHIINSVNLIIKKCQVCKTIARFVEQLEEREIVVKPR